MGTTPGKGCSGFGTSSSESRAGARVLCADRGLCSGGNVCADGGVTVRLCA